ncbi:serine/threonine-protein kinase VRK1-like isoform X2 [Prorops nasuta]|uniref:serine/threonine-protein kinase VRK1-like isoform X2 n=1 Tax=Prorops nasuta TaxID=863751 RepID=UPI0034CF3852
MAPRRAEEVPVKRVAALGCKLPQQLPAGEILTDITQKKWKLGGAIGYGGFGDIYLASDNLNTSVGQDAKYVIKIEPHNNGPLFVEMNFYIRAARRDMIDSWCKSQDKRRVGVPSYEGSGSHVYRDQRFRFLVIPRYGIDIGKFFLSQNRKLSTKLVNNLAIQMLDALEYIHSRGYAHADVKGSNILLALQGQNGGKENTKAYLVDYGLAYRFRTASGMHKPFVHDERRAHEGTLEFTSRDAHHGTHSRRGDLETLGYNILQWLCGRLPWENENGGMSLTANPDDVHSQKDLLFSDVTAFIKSCFPHKKNPPTSLVDYMKYIADLGFETKPNYSYLRGLFQNVSYQETNVPTFLFNMDESNENISCAKSYKRPNLRERRPCRPVNGEIRITRNTHPIVPKKEKYFSWEAVLARHPDKLAKVSIQAPPSPLTPPPSPPPQFLVPSPPSQPTYAMLHVLRRIKEKQSGMIKHRSSKSSDELKPKWMTPAMEEIAQLKKKAQEANTTNSNTTRLTRSRVAFLKRKANEKSFPEEETNSAYSRSIKKRKLLPSIAANLNVYIKQKKLLSRLKNAV